MSGEKRRSSHRSATASAAREDEGRRWLVLSVLVLAQFMVVLDVAIVKVGPPTNKTHLHFGETGLQGVITAYAILFGGVLLLGGRMADLLGRRRVFVAGLILFSAASLAGGLAQSPGWLVAAPAV